MPTHLHLLLCALALAAAPCWARQMLGEWAGKWCGRAWDPAGFGRRRNSSQAVKDAGAVSDLELEWDGDGTLVLARPTLADCSPLLPRW